MSKIDAITIRKMPDGGFVIGTQNSQAPFDAYKAVHELAVTKLCEVHDFVDKLWAPPPPPQFLVDPDVMLTPLLASIGRNMPVTADSRDWTGLP